MRTSLFYGSLLVGLMGLAACTPPSGSDAGDASTPSDHVDANDVVSHDATVGDAIGGDARFDAAPSDVAVSDATDAGGQDVPVTDALDATSGSDVLDAATDDAADAASDSDASVITMCTGDGGASTLVTLSGQLVQAGLGMMAPVGNGTVTLSLCPEMPIPTDDQGNYAVQVPIAESVYGMFSAPNYVTDLTEEVQFMSFESPPANQVQMFSSALATAFLPGYSATTATIVIDQIAIATGTSSNCSSPDGVTFSVDGHDANVAYYIGPPPIGAPPTSTDSHGVAVISVPVSSDAGSALDFVTITAIKAGCSVSFAYTDGDTGVMVTGRIPIIAGAITWAHPQMTDAMP